MPEVDEHVMVEEVERRLADSYADIPAERINSIVPSAYAQFEQPDPGLRSAVRRAPSPRRTRPELIGESDT